MGQARTMKLAFEYHLGEKISCNYNTVPWLVDDAVVLLNLSQSGQDGKTSYED